MLKCGPEGYFIDREPNVLFNLVYFSGNLRSVLASTGNSVYCCCWGPDDDQVAIGSDKTLMIKTVQVCCNENVYNFI